MRNVVRSACGAAGLWVLAATQAGAACAVQTPAGLSQSGTLTFGTMLSAPPQMFSENGEPAGFEIDLGKAIAGEMCAKTEFVNLPFAGLFPGLNAKKFDAITAGLGITPQREEVYDFVPYFLGGIRLVVRKDSGLSFRDENDLCGRSVATISGTTEARALERVNQEKCGEQNKIDVRYYPSFNESVQQLVKKTTEVAFVDWPFAAYITNLMPDLVPGSPIISGRPEVPRNRLGIAFRKGEPELRDAVAKALASVQANGAYDKLLDKWHLRDGDIRQAK